MPEITNVYVSDMELMLDEYALQHRIALLQIEGYTVLGTFRDPAQRATVIGVYKECGGKEVTDT